MTGGEVGGKIESLDRDMQRRFDEQRGDAAACAAWARWFAWYTGSVSAIHDHEIRGPFVAYAEAWRDRWNEAARTAA